MQNSPMKGMALCLAAFLLLPTMDAVAKLLSETMPVIQITWGRYFFHLVLLLPIVILRHGARSLLPPKLGIQILRGCIMLSGTLMFFGAIALMPLADALAIAFLSPILTTVFAALFLGEQVGRHRWIAVFVGFIGTLIIIRPGSAPVGLGTFMALGTGVAYAVYTVLTRRLSGTAPAMVSLVFSGIVGAGVLSLAIPAFWQAPSAAEWWLMVAMGMMGATAHFFLIAAYDYAEASFLAPISYTEMVTAAILGYALFGDLPDEITWLGIAVVIGAGLYISYRERQRNAESSLPTAKTPPVT